MKHPINIVLILLVVFFSQQILAQQNELAELKTKVHQLVDGVKGLSVGIVMVDESGPVWVEGIGKGNLEDGADVNADTMFRVGSVSKMFTGLAALKLVESGQLSLEDKLVDLAPDIEFDNPWAATNPVRLVHLLEHTAGWDEISYSEYRHNDPTPVTLKQGLDVNPDTRTSRWVPGTRYAYSNAGTAAAAYMVQKASGQEFEAFVAQHFFEPLGMHSTTYRLSKQMKAKSVNLFRPYEHIHIRPSGAINISPNDMAKFIGFLVKRGRFNGQQLISETSLKRMETAKSSAGAGAGLEVGYGLTNHSNVFNQWVYRMHTGGINGSITSLAYLPEAKVGYVVMVNGTYHHLITKITDTIRAYQTRNLTPKQIRPAVAVTKVHKAIEGFYQPINPRLALLDFAVRLAEVERLYFVGDTLKRGGMSDLYPINDTQYIDSETGLVTLVKTTDPLVGEVVHFERKVLAPVNIVWLSFQYLVVFFAVALIWLTVCLMVWLSIVRVSCKIQNKPYASASGCVRFWPMLTGVAVLVSLGFIAVTYGFTGFSYRGSANWATVSVMLSTVAFAVFAVLSLYSCIKHRQTKMRRFSYWFWTVASVVYCLIVIYLAWFGIIGVRIWA